MARNQRKSVQLVLCVIGILFSMYAYYVETSKERDSSYTAFCDVNSRISCSKVFSSKWGRGMGLLEDFIGGDHMLNQPNSVFGFIFYLLIIALEFIPGLMAARVELMASILSAASCVWLAYILFIVLQDICIVCCTMYVVNTCILIASIIRYNSVSSSKKNKKRQ